MNKQTKAPTISAEIFVIPLEGARYIVYAPLRRTAFVANSGVVNFLADLKEGVLRQALDPDGSLVEFLRRVEILDAGEEPLPVVVPNGLPEPTTVTLFLTTSCNLCCTYCYASAGDVPHKSMPLEVALRGIDFVAANAARKNEPFFEVLYHGGGEPTVHWRVLVASSEYACRKAAELNLESRCAVASNGVLTDAQIDWMITNLHSVNLSFDGLPEAHDRHRLTADGRASSARVIHTIRRFDEAGFPYGLRVTVTRDQIAALPDSIDFICDHFSTEQIQVEPAYRLGRWSKAPSAETEEFISSYRQARIRARRHGREIGYSAARLGILTNHFCGVSRDSFALSPDGRVSSCYEVFSEDQPLANVFFYGSPGENGAYTFDPAALTRLRSLGVENRAFCRGCFARWTCAGDCYHKALTVHGGRGFQGSDRCHITRQLTTDQILEKIAGAGGWFWHDGPLHGQDCRPAGKTGKGSH